MKPKPKMKVAIAIGVKKPTGNNQGGMMKDDDNDSPDDMAPDGDADEDDQNDMGEPMIRLPEGYSPPDDVEPGEEIPFLGKMRPNGDGTATICSIDGAPYSKNEDSDKSDDSEMKLDDDTPSPSEQDNGEDMDNSQGSMANRIQQLRMKMKR